MKILEKRVDDVFKGKKKEFLWILEHNITYTAGVGSTESDVIDKNTKIGQKIAYFVLNLNKRKKDIRLLINQVERCIIDILKEYKIDSYSDKKNIGIWVNSKDKSKKVAAIGIKVKKWVAYHGFALNLSIDLSLYKKIIPCGIKNKGVTNLKELGIKNFNGIEKIMVEKFLDIFL